MGALRKALDMPPGYITQCPYGLEFFLPIKPWITTEWVIVYALCAETALLGLGLLILRLRRPIPCGMWIYLPLVALCATGALAVALWMTSLDIQSCYVTPFAPHVTLPGIIQADRLYEELLTQARVTLGILAALFFLATALVIVTLVRGWRGNGRRSATAPV